MESGRPLPPVPGICSAAVPQHLPFRPRRLYRRVTGSARSRQRPESHRGRNSCRIVSVRRRCGLYRSICQRDSAHLAIFGLLIAGCNVSGSDATAALGYCGFGIAFFHRVPDLRCGALGTRHSGRHSHLLIPLDSLRPSAPDSGNEEHSKIPTGAIILIVARCAVSAAHCRTAFGFDRFWPLHPDVPGSWLFARNYGLLGEACTDPLSRKRRTHGACSAVHGRHALSAGDCGCCKFHRTWPVILLVIGAVKLLQGIRFALGFRRQLSWRSSGAIGEAGSRLLQLSHHRMCRHQLPRHPRPPAT